MPHMTLEEVQHLVDRLTPLEQAQLMEYISFRIARAMASREPAQSGASSHDGQAWKKFFEIGDALMASDAPELETLTTSVLKMRR
ncbi:MAG: hypothetical protein HUU32_09970 [Calditrichaceae bacterium]|nr:hypothetical protein [Calditrichia bacterium]NUQ41707.1 hypothetical protein [Calditrichaceae bacterium]